MPLRYVPGRWTSDRTTPPGSSIFSMTYRSRRSTSFTQIPDAAGARVEERTAPELRESDAEVAQPGRRLAELVDILPSLSRPATEHRAGETEERFRTGTLFVGQIVAVTQQDEVLQPHRAPHGLEILAPLANGRHIGVTGIPASLAPPWE